MQSNFSKTTTKNSIFLGWEKSWGMKEPLSFVHLILLFMWWNYTHFIIQKKRAIARNISFLLYIFIFFLHMTNWLFFCTECLNGGLVWQKEEFEKFVSWYKLLDIIIFPTKMNEQSEITEMLCNLWMNLCLEKLNWTICFVVVC